MTKRTPIECENCETSGVAQGVVILPDSKDESLANMIVRIPAGWSVTIDAPEDEDEAENVLFFCGPSCVKAWVTDVRKEYAEALADDGGEDEDEEDDDEDDLDDEDEEEEEEDEDDEEDEEETSPAVPSKKPPVLSREELVVAWEELQKTAKKRGFKREWAVAMFKAQFGVSAPDDPDVHGGACCAHPNPGKHTRFGCSLCDCDVPAVTK